MNLIRLIDPKDLPRFLKCKFKAYAIEDLPRSVSRALYGSFVGEFEWIHYDRNRNILAHSVDYNSLSDQGEQDMLETFYRNISAPSGDFYLGLLSATPTDTSTLTGITEVTGTGYSRQMIARSIVGWPTAGLDNGDYQLTSLLRTFMNTGGSSWTGATYAFLCSVSSGTSGRFWNYVALSTTRTLAPSESLDFTYKVKLQ